MAVRVVVRRTRLRRQMHIELHTFNIALLLARGLQVVPSTGAALWGAVLRPGGGPVGRRVHLRRAPQQLLTRL